MISVKNISKNFEENVLFEDLSFSINKGEKICVVADSGKGKSTLIRILLGLENFNKGEIKFGNLILNEDNISKIREKIAWLPQDLSISLQKGEELIELLDLDIEKFSIYLKDLGLNKNLLYQDFQSLSGGQKQRLLLSACLSLEKQILILDEPTSALDKTSIALMIKTIYAQENLTMISASHNEVWKNACNRIIEI